LFYFDFLGVGMTGGESESQAHGAANGESPPAQDPGAAAPADAVAQLTEALAAAQAKADENHGLYLRALAESENIRRRTQEDISKAHKYAIESFAESLVPVFDSLEKALGDASTNAGALREGVEITLRQLRSAFERGRLTEINPVGEKFDPNRHQAISALPGDGTVPANHVITVLQKGWLIADRVLRPALVTVVQAG
jgi:molecular chaperone GrpE